MRKLKFPTAHSVLLIIAALVAGLTWLVPSGQFDRLAYNKDSNQFIRTGINGDTSLAAEQATLDRLGIKVPLEKFTSGDIYKPVAIPGTYSNIDSNPQGFIAFLQSPLKGIMEAIDVILFVLIIGGFIGIVNKSGAFDAGIAGLAKNLKGREFWLIIIITALIAAGGTTFGLAEETIAFYPILVPVFLAAGYDAIVALAAIYLGSSMGTMASTVNPFSTIIASDAAGTNWVNGMYGRFLMLGLGVAICIWYIIRYAEKVKKDPSKSIIADQKEEIDALFLHKVDTREIVFNSRVRLILLGFLACFVVMIYGVARLDWWFLEMTTVFFVGAIIMGILAQMKEGVFVREFVKGANDLLGVALIIGIARGVTVLMEDGQISDTMLYYSSQAVEGMPKALFINVMMLLYAGLSFFISSSSGMAVLTMPIMAPLGDVVDVGREQIVNAYMYGMGLFFFINPTGLILASLGMIQVGFNRWVKFILPLMGILLVLTVVILTAGVYL